MRVTKMAIKPTNNPRKVRNATNVNGCISRMAILIHRKDELHIAARRIKANHCLGFNSDPSVEVDEIV